MYVSTYDRSLLSWRVTGVRWSQTVEAPCFPAHQTARCVAKVRTYSMHCRFRLCVICCERTEATCTYSYEYCDVYSIEPLFMINYHFIVCSKILMLMPALRIWSGIILTSSMGLAKILSVYLLCFAIIDCNHFLV